MHLFMHDKVLQLGQSPISLGFDDRSPAHPDILSTMAQGQEPTTKAWLDTDFYVAHMGPWQSTHGLTRSSREL